MKIKKIAIAIATLICFLCVTLMEPFSFAWMSDNGLSSPIDITSNVHKAYFESGDGTKDLIRDEKTGEVISGPFEIASPLQLYYFAWLQYLGFFNVDNDEDGVIDTIYFRLSKDIDMVHLNEDNETVAYVLPPIGTTDTPFLGNFDGEGHTITDLTVENTYDNFFEAPEGTDNFRGAEIIGFFGVVGELTKGSYKYDTQANAVRNVVLENITIKTQTKSALVGFVAGYVNGLVDCVGVVGATVNVASGTTPLSYTGSLSDYSLIGYCMPEYKNEVYILGSSLTNPNITAAYTLVPDNTSGGSSQGWGGSVKMSDIYTWLSAVAKTSGGRVTSNSSYVNERTDVVTLGGSTVTATRTAATKLVYEKDGFGSFVITNSSPDYVNFVSGAQKVTQYVYSQTEKDVTVYYIKDGNYYLRYDGDFSAEQNVGNATKWYATNGANGGTVFTVLNGHVYYLTIANNNLAVIADVNADYANLPSWDFSGSQCSLNGVPIQCVNGTWQIPSTTKYKIAYNGNYLHYSGTNVGNTTSQSTAATWTITQVNGGYTISTTINYQTYYLGYTQTSNYGYTTYSASLSTNATTWQYDQTNRRLYMNLGGNNRYLRYSNGWGFSTSQYSLTFTGVYDGTFTADLISSNSTEKEILWKQSAYIDNSLQNGYYDANGNRITTGAGVTYFPLSTTVTIGQNANQDSFSIDSNNTGYIIGAEWGAIENSEHDQYGNIRIASYSASSMDDSSTRDIDESTTPYTLTYKTGGKFKTITDRNDSTLKNLGLQKFADCYQDYINSIQSSCCGLHFMQASVSTSNMTRITATLNGKTIENYQVPTNCIDFNLYDRGFINFVAGSYFTAQGTNDSFFSIYEIVRDPNDETSILEIKEIRKIYAQLNANGEIDTSKPYYYTYGSGNTETGTDKIPSTYTMVFDCRWITHPNDSAYYGASGGPSAWQNNRAFYFEVPVNAGEYAIGSTAGRTGAYLVYLDLAANAQLLERVQQYEEILETKAEASVPNGVEMLLPSENGYDVSTINPFDSAFITINPSASGNITVNQTGENEITVTANSGGVTAEYVSVDTVLKDGNGSPLTVPIVRTTKIERTTYRDYNINTGDHTVTVITKTTVTEGSDTTVTYTKEVTITDAAGKITTKPTVGPQAEQLFPDTVDKPGMPTTSTGDKLIDLAFAYGQEVGVTISYYFIPAETTTDANGNVTVTKAPIYRITITNPGADVVSLKAILTEKGVESGITFIITDGVTETILNATTDAQKVEIATAPAQETPPADDPTNEPADDPTT